MINKKYILAIIAVLLCVIFCLSGCSRVYEYESGDFHIHLWVPDILIGVRAPTDTFSIDNVTLDLYYSFYENAHPLPEGAYTHYTESGFMFALYVSNNNSYTVAQGEIIDDYKNVKNKYFVKEITEEEFYNGYGYSYNRRTGTVTHDHSEAIIIPKELFNQKSGKIYIVIYNYNTSDEYEGKYRRRLAASMYLTYEILDENTVKLNFDKIRRK